MNKILSVVIPSYNVENFLKDTLESFIDERIMKDIEIIIVDDGSKDNTALIAKTFCEKYPDTFKLISKENGGHGSTINTGISVVTGKYFKVVDGDDWVNTSDFEILVNNLSSTNSDMVFTNYTEFYEDTLAEVEINYDGYEEGKEYPFSEIAKNKTIQMHAIVFKTSLLRDNNITLDEHCFYVDVEYILFPLPYVKTVTYFDLHVYMYRLAQATQSVSAEGYKKHIDNHTTVVTNLCKFADDYAKSQDCDDATLGYINRRVAEMVFVQGEIYSSYGLFDKQAKKDFINFDNQIWMLNEDIYDLAAEVSLKIKLLRKVSFKFYPLIIALSNMRRSLHK